MVLNFTQDFGVPEPNRIALYMPLRGDYYGFDTSITQTTLAGLMRVYAQQLPTAPANFSITKCD
jgi:hypothetical protein